MDRRWSWLRVIESDELVGKISLVSRLPQYLCVCLVSEHLKNMAAYALYAGDIDWGGRSGMVDGHVQATIARIRSDWI